MMAPLPLLQNGAWDFRLTPLLRILMRVTQTWRELDVHFISSLPVMQGNAYKTWVDSTPVQMVWAGDLSLIHI